MPAQQQHHVTDCYLSSGTVAVGQCVVKNAAGTGYIVATAANRTSEDRRSAGIALRAGDANNTSFEMQVVGEVPPSITGLGTGTATLVRVSSAGVLERTDAYSTSDDVCGHCDEDGTAYVCFPLVGLGAALGASSAPGLPARSIQYYLDANTLGGAAHASISTDGYIESGTAPFADEGGQRYSFGLGQYVRDHDNSRNICVWKDDYIASTSDVVAQDRIYPWWGGDSTKAPTVVISRVQHVINFNVGTSGIQAGIGIYGPNWLTSAPDQRHVIVHPNLWHAHSAEETTTQADPFKGGLGYDCWSARATPASGNPAAGRAWMYADETTLHPMWRLPDGTLYDLTDTGSGEGTFATITSTGTIPDVDVTGVRTIKVTSNGNVTIPGLTAPAAGESKHVTLILEPPADTTYTLSNNNGDDLANGFDFGGADLTVANPATKLFTVVYDHDAALWKPVGVAV